MTRATVGGINSEDNLWYPLAVNSQGIAQIDTSGIPKVPEWTTGFIEPKFISDDENPEIGVITYNSRSFCNWYKIQKMMFVQGFIATDSCVITNPRGNLLIDLESLPFYYQNANKPSGFIRTNSEHFQDIEFNRITGETLYSPSRVQLFGPSDETPNARAKIPVTRLTEHSESVRNSVSWFGWFYLGDLPGSFLSRMGDLLETEAGTP